MYQSTLLEFLNMGGGEITLIMVAVLLLFGGKKLPELARGLGKGIREFKDASEGVKREIHRNINAVDLDDQQDDNLAQQRERQNQNVEMPTNTAVHDTPVAAAAASGTTINADNTDKANEIHS